MKLNQLYSNNKLRLGTFSSNLVNCQTLVREAWHPQWSDVLAAAIAADQAGFEAIVPVARWKGYVDRKIEHRSNDAFDTFSFAAALGQATSHSTIFSTVHASLVHPLMMAKIGSTIDHITQGRWALNVVGGWNRREFEMFGVDMRDHQARYDYLEEWLRILRALWTATDEIDWSSKDFHLKAAVCRPRPLQQPTPPIMNAGFSPSGRRFAARNSDMGFVMITAGDHTGWRDQVQEVKTLGREAGRDLHVWTAAHIVQAPTRAEAVKYIDDYAIKNADQEGIDGQMATLVVESGLAANEATVAMYRKQLAIGSGWVLAGPPEYIADELQAMAEAGFDGVLLGWVNFTDGIAQFARDIMPLLEARGLRLPFVR